MSRNEKKWSYDDLYAGKKAASASFYQLGDDLTIMSSDIKIGGAENNWTATKPKVNKSGTVVLTAEQRRNYVYDVILRVAGTRDRVMAARRAAIANGVVARRYSPAVAIKADTGGILTSASMVPNGPNYNVYARELATRDANAAEAKKIKEHPFSKAVNSEAIWAQLKDAKKAVGGGPKRPKGPLGEALRALALSNPSTPKGKKKALDVSEFLMNKPTFKSHALPSTSRGRWIASQEAMAYLPMLSLNREGYTNALRWLNANDPSIFNMTGVDDAGNRRDANWFLNSWNNALAQKNKAGTTSRTTNIPTQHPQGGFGGAATFNVPPGGSATVFDPLQAQQGGFGGATAFNVPPGTVNPSQGRFSAVPQSRFQAEPSGGQSQGGFSVAPQGGFSVVPGGGTVNPPQGGFSVVPQGGTVNPPQGGFPVVPQGGFGAAPDPLAQPTTGAADPLLGGMNIGASGQGDTGALVLGGVTDTTEESMGGTASTTT